MRNSSKIKAQNASNNKNNDLSITDIDKTDDITKEKESEINEKKQSDMELCDES